MNNSGSDKRVSTHTPRAGRDGVVSNNNVAPASVSTHTPRAGRDLGKAGEDQLETVFQPTRPVRGVT